MLAMAGAAVLGPVAGSITQAIAAGVLYGAADAAIKADAVALRVHGVGGLLSGWTVLAGLCTFGGFLCLQAALRRSDAVRPISLMTAFTALTAAGLGVVAFGEPFGTTPPASVAHGVAIVLVLACVWPLARAQQRLIVPVSAVGSAEQPGEEPARETEETQSGPGSWPKPASAAALLRASRVAAAVVLAFLAVGVCSLVAVGLLYSLRGLQPLAIGPSVPDALPLLQLAGFDAQPLAATVVASLAAGAVLGLALRRASRSARLVSVRDPRTAAPTPGVRRLLRTGPQPEAERCAPEPRARDRSLDRGATCWPREAPPFGAGWARTRSASLRGYAAACGSVRNWRGELVGPPGGVLCSCLWPPRSRQR